MKKSYLVTIGILLLAIGALLAYLFLFPNPSAKNDNNTVDDPADTNKNENDSSETGKNENGSSDSQSGENSSSPSQATIQEDEGNLVIIIPDDQESAGE